MNATMIDQLSADRQAGQRVLAFAFVLAAVVFVLEVVGGTLTNSLALIADAGHVLSDLLAVSLAIGAVWMARRPASERQSFGYQRAEVLATAANGGMLLLVAAYVFWQAARRFADPPDVDSGPMLAIAAIGLVANAASALLLFPQQERSMTVRGAFYHVVADLLGSIGAVIAGVVMLATGWFFADPLIGVLIGLLALLAAGRLLRESLTVLLEVTPGHIDPREVESALLATPGVTGLHDLHIWTVTSGLVALSCHCELAGTRDSDGVLAELCDMLHDRFEIHHVTIQPEVTPLHGGEGHSLPRCTSVLGHEHRPASRVG